MVWGAGATAFPGTLAQVVSNPDLLKSWYEKPNGDRPLTPEIVKNSTAFLTVPLSSLSPRIALLDVLESVEPRFIELAGEVKAKGERRRARSDWMKIEQQRGISVTSSVMTFERANPDGSVITFNLLDTPGHEDFSEDTYRTLTAVAERPQPAHRA